MAVDALNSVDSSLGSVTQSAGESANALQTLTNALFTADLVQNLASAIKGYSAELIHTADAYKMLESRAGLLHGSAEETAAVMDELRRIAIDTHTPLETTGDLYVRLGNALKDSGASTQEVLGITEALNNALRVSGASGQEAAGALTQLGQALASGALRGDEFNSVNEAMPVLMEAVAQSMGVTRGELRGLAEQGLITADEVKKAVTEMAGTWEAQAATMPVTLQNALDDLGTAWAQYLGESENVDRVTSLLTNSLGTLANNLDQVAGLAQTGMMGVLAAGMVKAAQSVTAYSAQLQANRVALEQRTAAEALAAERAAQGTIAIQQRTQALARQAIQAQASAQAELQAANQAVAAATAQRNATQSGMARLAAEERLILALQARNAAEARASVATQGATAAQRTAAAAATANAAAQRAAAEAANRTAGAAGGLGGALRNLRDPMNAVSAGMALMMGYQLGGWIKEAAEAAEAWYNPLQLVKLGLEGLDEALSDLSPAYAAQIESERNLTETQKKTADMLAKISEQTGITLTSTEALNEAVKNGTVVWNTTKGAYEAGAVSMKQAADSSGALDIALKNQAAALEDLSEKQALETQTAIERIKAAADLAKTLGDEEQALRLVAGARTLALNAAVEQQGIAKAGVASAQAALANLEAEAAKQGALTVAMRDQLTAARENLEAKQQAATAAGTTVAALEAEAAAARLAADTFGDQSGRITELTAKHEALQNAADANTAAIQAGTTAQEALAKAEQDAILAAAAYRNALASGAQDTDTFAAASLRATAEVDHLRQQIAAGEAAQARDAALKREVSEAAVRLADSYDDLAEKQSRAVEDARGMVSAIESETDARVTHLENLAEEAKARGDSAKAAELEKKATEATMAGIQAKILALQAEKAAQDVLLQTLIAKAQLDGVTSPQEQAAIAAAIAKAKAIGAESEALAEKLRHLQALQGVQGDVNDQTDKGAEANEKAARSAHTSGAAHEFLAGELQKVGIAAEYMDTAQSAANAAYAEAAAETAAWVDELGALSNGLTTSGGIALRFADEYVERLQAQEKAAIAAGEAAAAHAKRLDEYNSRLEKLNAEYDSGEISLALFIRGMENATGAAKQLGGEELRELRKAIADAKEKMDDFTSSAEDGLRSLQQEWAELNGQQLDALKIEQQQERLDIEEQIAEAREMGNYDAERTLEAQLRLLDQIHDKETNSLRAEIEEAEAAEAERHRETLGNLGTEKAASGFNRLPEEDARHSQTMSNLAEEEAAAKRIADDLGTVSVQQAGAPTAGGGSVSINTASLERAINDLKTTISTVNSGASTGVTDTQKTVRLEIDSAALFGDERAVNDFLKALERAGLRAV